MTERERLRTLGLYYSRVTRNRQKSIESYAALVDKYPADDAAHNGLAIQYFYMLDFQSALKEGRVVLDIYPGSVMGRSNYALYAMYASDFETAVAEAEKVRELDPTYFKAWLPVAMKAMSENNYDMANDAYRNMTETGARGASTASLGLADVAIFSGQFETARDILVEGIAVDEETGNNYGAAAKYMALTEALQGLGQAEAAMDALQKGLALTSRESSTVPAAIWPTSGCFGFTWAGPISKWVLSSKRWTSSSPLAIGKARPAQYSWMTCLLSDTWQVCRTGWDALRKNWACNQLQPKIMPLLSLAGRAATRWQMMPAQPPN
jgi:tetratricopeptide (TPR) repeat protein